MKEHIYWHDNTVIIDYSELTVNTSKELLQSETFDLFLREFLSYLEKHNYRLYQFLMKDHTDTDSVIQDMKSVLQLLLVLEREQIADRYAKYPHILIDIIDEAYNFWRSKERYSILVEEDSNDGEKYERVRKFIDADHVINEMALQFYRSLQHNTQSDEIHVYRQLQASTTASMMLERYNWNIPEGYECLRGIPFIHEIVLKTPLLLHSKCNKRTNVFTEVYDNPIHDFRGETKEWVCYPAKVGNMLIYCYFHRNYMTGVVGMSSLFELSGKKDALKKKPDAILLFGNQDDKKETSFYYDEKENLWIGKDSAMWEIDYFGYVKKSVLTLHNLAQMQRGWLPIHGAMVNIYLKDGTKKGIVLMGDSGAGKSETLEALSKCGEDYIDHTETVFDDMGTLHIDENGNIRAQGTEIGAFVRLDDLDQGAAYRDMDRSIFFNPEKKNARVVVPAAPYRTVVQNHPVDCFMYANNYTDKRGLHFFENKEEAKPVFLEGKRNALGTTQEKGLSTTFFANPFGPMQKQEECMPIINRIFEAMIEQNIPIGEIYTYLGLPNKGDGGIDEAAKALLEFVKSPVK